MKKKETVQVMEMFDEIDGGKTFITREDLEKIIKKEEPKTVFDQLEVGKEYKQEVFELGEEPKQETLEEVAERIFKTHSNNTPLAEGHYDYMMDKEDFKEASLEITKWQQEQDKNKYSEEEVLDIVHKCGKYCYDSKKIGTDIGLMPNLLIGFFEQFKKK